MSLLKSLQRIILSAHESYVSELIGGAITYDDLRKELLKHARSHKIHISDNTFATISRDSMAKIIKVIPTRKFKYVPESRDCDDFSFSFMGACRIILPGFAVGIIWSKVHAFNFFVDNSNKIWIIEPQTGEIYDYDIIKDTYLYGGVELIVI